MTPAQRAEYDRDGFVLMDPVLPEGLLDGAREEITERLAARKASLGPGARRYRETVSDLHHECEGVRDLIRQPFFVEASRILLGDEVDLRFSLILTKTADHGEPVQWHQDWGLGKDTGHPLFSFWIAISDADEGNGCLRIYPGSHKDPLLPHTVSSTHPPDLGIAVLDGRGSTALPMKAGKVLLIHPQVIHGSGKNESGKPRIALLGSFQAPKTVLDAFWAKAGASFLRKGAVEWGPLAATA